MAKRRSDAERRVRQCERLARVLRLLRLLLGHGRWNAEALARELECSVRTLFRDLNVLSAAGVPVHFDRNSECYGVAESYRFPRLERQIADSINDKTASELRQTAGQLIVNAEKLLAQLRKLCGQLQLVEVGEKRA